MQNLYYPQGQSFQNQGFGHIQPNILPPQQVIKVNGKASVDTIQMSPNSSVLLLDSSAPIVWLCMSDGIGRVASTPYDITIHKEETPTDVSDIETRLSAIEQTIEELKERKNDKSYVAKSNPKQCDSKHISNQANNERN